MMQAVRGIYRDGVVELLEKPAVMGDTEVVVTFLTAGTWEPREEPAEEGSGPLAFAEDAPPLDDFEPIVPAQTLKLSDIVLEDRG